MPSWVLATENVSRKADASGGAGTHIAVTPEVLQELDLAQRALGEDLLTEDIGDLLNGYALAGLVVRGGASSRVSQLPRPRDRPSAQPERIHSAPQYGTCMSPPGPMRG